MLSLPDKATANSQSLLHFVDANARDVRGNHSTSESMGVPNRVRFNKRDCRKFVQVKGVKAVQSQLLLLIHRRSFRWISVNRRSIYSSISRPRKGSGRCSRWLLIQLLWSPSLVLLPRPRKKVVCCCLERQMTHVTLIISRYSSVEKLQPRDTLEFYLSFDLSFRATTLPLLRALAYLTDIHEDTFSYDISTQLEKKSSLKHRRQKQIWIHHRVVSSIVWKRP